MSNPTQFKSLQEAQNVISYLTRHQKLSPTDFEEAMNVIRTKQDKKTKIKTKQKTSKDPFRNARMRPIAMQIAYDGANFNGFAENVGNVDDRSVERELFAALVKCCLVKDRPSSKYSRCGRTDKGVSAYGQVVGLSVRSAIPLRDGEGNEVMEDRLPRNSYQGCSVLVSVKGDDGGGGCEERVLREMDFCKVLNGLLPEEIRAIGWCPVTDGFSARFSAKDRTYRYFFAERDLNISAMNDGLSKIVGEHDFRNLAKMDTENVTNFKRKILKANVVRNEVTCEGQETNRSISYFEITGQAFLWHMVRCIVAISFMIGRNVEGPTLFDDLFDIKENPGKPSYQMAPELPLVLHNCGYHNLILGHSVANLWEVTCHLEARWERLTLAAARAKNFIDALKSESLVRKDDLKDFIQLRFKRNIHDIGKHEFVSSKDHISWGEALNIIFTSSSKVPGPIKELSHTPLMNRSRGLTYEEKLIGMRGRKKKRFDENQQKRDESKFTDTQFYDSMAQQGGTGM